MIIKKIINKKISLHANLLVLIIYQIQKNAERKENNKNLQFLVIKDKDKLQNLKCQMYKSSLNYNYEMFEGNSLSRREKNWKILNRNFNQIQDNNQFNRSSLIEQTKRYNPHKDSSKQRIFSKSKQRMNQSGSEGMGVNSFYLKGITRQVGVNKQKQPTQKFPQSNLSTNRLTQQGQTPYSNSTIVGKMESRNQNTQVQEEYLQGRKQTRVMNSSVNHSRQNSIICNNSAQNQRRLQEHFRLRDEISCNSSVIKEMKEQFQIFKSSVIAQINLEKQLLKKTIEDILNHMDYIQTKMREEVYAQIQMKFMMEQANKKSLQSQSRKNSTDIKIQQLNLMNLTDEMKNSIQQYNQFSSLRLPDVPKLEPNSNSNIHTFGAIEQSSIIEDHYQNVIPNTPLNYDFQQSTTNIELKNNQQQSRKNLDEQSSLQHAATETQLNRVQDKRQNFVQTLKISKSSQDFSINTIQNPVFSRQQIVSLCSVEQSSQVTPSQKDSLSEIQENRRYSEILKKQYQQKGKTVSSQITDEPKVFTKDKMSLNERMNHLQKFHGAMQKLKSDIKQIKTISDTKDIRRIKFSQTQLKQIKLNQLNGQMRTGIPENQAS